MKEIRKIPALFILRANTKWESFSPENRRRYLKLIFILYFILTLVMLLRIGMTTGKGQNKITVEHIENSPIKRSEKAPVFNPSNHK